MVGSADGTGSNARFSSPRGVVVDAAGDVYVADTFNNTIRKVTPVGVVKTWLDWPAQRVAPTGRVVSRDLIIPEVSRLTRLLIYLWRIQTTTRFAE